MSFYPEIKYDINYARENLRWNGWGAYDHPFLLEKQMPAILKRLHAAIGIVDSRSTPSIAQERLRMPSCRLKRSQLAALERILGRGQLSTSRLDRILHSRGQSYYDLIRIRNGLLGHWVDGVAFPRNEATLLKLFRWAESNRCALVPVGGASSVVGGIEALPGKCRSVLALNLQEFRGLLSFDEESRIATFGAGAYGPLVEAALNQRGYTLGHFPQSFEYSTIGGWAAARSAGQQSMRYGKIEDLIVALRIVTPQGVIETLRAPAQAAGPDLKNALVGSEGIFGVISQVTVHIRPLPERRSYFAAYFPDFSHGLAFVREASGLGLAMARLSDAAETRMLEQLAYAGGRSGMLARVKQSLQDRFLRLIGMHSQRSLAVIGVEGERTECDALEARARKALRRHGGFFVGYGPGRSWLRGRFNMPFLRNHLMDQGIGVDTMETSVQYSKLSQLHQSVLQTLSAATRHNVSMAHVSHSYADGACLYFTTMFDIDERNPVDQWRRLKRATTESIIAAGGSLSHHHGVGADHRAWYSRTYGKHAAALLAAWKRDLDPGGILNPDKVFNRAAKGDRQ
ncbi:MAG: FAD-binding oxidoreductase [Leptospirales bacterium]|nr:FAD-binding oxidoreductase [Leptospirales bacterium]